MRSFRPITPGFVRRVLLAFVIGVTAAANRPARADNETQRQSLAGIGGVHVHLALEGDDLAANQLTDATLRPEIESRLTAVGLRLLTPEGSAKEPGVPWLFVSVSLQKSTDSKAYVWSVRFEFEQRACLERDPKVCGSAATWSSHRFGSVGRRRVQTIQQDILDTANEFVAAYGAANPRH